MLTARGWSREHSRELAETCTEEALGQPGCVSRSAQRLVLSAAWQTLNLGSFSSGCGSECQQRAWGLIQTMISGKAGQHSDSPSPRMLAWGAYSFPCTAAPLSDQEHLFR